jgi:hypothetical protein
MIKPIPLVCTTFVGPLHLSAVFSFGVSTFCWICVGESTCGVSVNVGPPYCAVQQAPAVLMLCTHTHTHTHTHMYVLLRNLHRLLKPVICMFQFSGFGGLGVCVLPSGTQDRGFAPDRSRRIFHNGKNPQHAVRQDTKRTLEPKYTKRTKLGQLKKNSPAVCLCTHSRQ